MLNHHSISELDAWYVWRNVDGRVVVASWCPTTRTAVQAFPTELSALVAAAELRLTMSARVKRSIAAHAILLVGLLACLGFIGWVA